MPRLKSTVYLSQIETRRKTVYEPIETRLALTEKKIKLLLEKIKKETNKIEIEWLTLKSLADPKSGKTELSSIADLTNNGNISDLDNVRSINTEEIKFEPIEVMKADSSESESEFLSDIEEDENLMNIFI